MTQPRAALIAPSAGLAACVRAYVSRSTLGADLQPLQRLNYFPATPLCGISWLSHGESYQLPTGDGDTAPQRLPRVAFFGPQSRPTVSRNPGPAEGFMLMLMPDALHALTGVDVGALVDRTLALHQVLDADWCVMAEAVLQAGDDASRVRLIEAFIAPRWQAARQLGAVPVRSYQDWAQGLALRAMASGMGQSLRQAERRIKAWTGQTLRQLQGRSRAEAVFFQARDAVAAGSVDWADLAAGSGYADQSHFCREARRVTGLSPEVLRRRMLEDESFWIYRIWG
ncbi:AraC-like DNA-binding protein [Rhodoferax ferrireducens]|uniref:AraC-like DNA-binding protein n=1 Tax=Rhodoferax ferrireducens TaxID=192843 RepID=A0ABU2C849_9BURK|nr:AraC family transcriptional regulator [Rhodoferax ferrireducens]MDR7377504.1 AraC-like DNA-binding protein [Rhodoferax ferrireducens]